MIKLKTDIKPFYRDDYVTLFNGDCLEVMGHIESSSVDCILTDPPYGMNWRSGRRKDRYDAIENDSDLKWVDEWLKKSFDVLKNDRHFYSFCSWHNIDLFKAKIDGYFDLKNILVWVKNNHGSGDLFGDYAPMYENVLFACKGNPKLFGKRESNVLEFDKTANNYHPTEKPVNLLSFLLNKSCRKDYVVLDMFAGSGSTGVAAKMLGLQCILVEKDVAHCETAVKRLNFECLAVAQMEDVEEDVVSQMEFELK